MMHAEPACTSAAGAATALPPSAPSLVPSPPQVPPDAGSSLKAASELGLDASPEPSAVPAPACELVGQNVVLRVEVATKGQAHLLTWIVWVLNVLFVLAAAGLTSSLQTYDTLEQVATLHVVHLCVGCVCLAVLVLMAAWMAGALRAAQREQRLWAARRRHGTATVAALLACQVTYSALYVAGCALVVAQPDCAYPWTPLAALGFCRKLSFSFFLVIVLSNLFDMRLWRGKAALDADPDRLLLLDQPWPTRLAHKWLLLLIWLALLAEAVVSLVGQLDPSASGQLWDLGGCSTSVPSLDCRSSVYQVEAACVGMATMLFMLGLYLWTSLRAIRDQKSLPFVRYRATYVWTRVQVRLMGPLLVAVVLCTILLGFIPVVVFDSCNSVVFLVTGNLPIQLALTTAAFVLALLYMPASAELDSPLLQEFLQDFSWTLAAMPSDLDRRNRRLQASVEARRLGDQRRRLAGRVAMYVPHQLQRALGHVVRVQDVAAAEEQLRNEPLFCMELAIKLLHWSILAYYPETTLRHNRHLSAAAALADLGLQHWEVMDELGADVHCLLGWGGDRVVLAFRGTESLQNVLTDIKAYSVPHLPLRRYRGRRVCCHAGFYSAWLAGGFNSRVLDQLHEIGKQAAGRPMHVYVTGHSLGGALAVLACSDIRRALPACQITSVTFGCPRVFNRAGANEFGGLVPDTWAILNASDPVPWMPKWGFKRVGKRVNIDAGGNLVLRPSFFELSVVHRGAAAGDHLTAAYALSLAAVLKAQFSPSKRLDGGAAGVEALAAAMDLGRCLILQHADLASLQDPYLLPTPTSVSDAPNSSSNGSKLAKRRRTGCCGSGPAPGSPAPNSPAADELVATP